MWLAIAEPDPALADVLAFSAQRRGHQAVCVSNIDRLLQNLPFPPSVLVIGMDELSEPEMERLGRVREHHADATLLVTTEESDDRERGRLLRAGVNDVILSPYNPVDVLIKAEHWAASRTTPASTVNTLKVGDLRIDLGHYYAEKNGQSLVLTKLELRLLFCLCEHHPHLVPVERLLRFGWDATDDPDPTLIKTHISHIRRKLDDAGGQAFEIRSRQTVGYVLTVRAGEQ